MRTKVCSGECGLRLPLDEVHFALKNRQMHYYRADCKTCYNKKKRKPTDTEEARIERRNRQRLSRERNRALVAAHVATHPCVDCGESDPVVLDFDHVRGEKRRNVSRMVASHFSEKNILAEIEKCEVVCANCHRRRTAKRGSWHKAGIAIGQS